jgi:hypothetical protein
MQIAVRLKIMVTAMAPVVGALACAALLSACASAPRNFAAVSLDTPAASFTNGRVMFLLKDENGTPMTRTRVDMSWETPQFYKTSAFTDFNGQVTFKGVPEVAEVSIDHPGGNFTRTLIVPQQGMVQMPVILDTYGENAMIRYRESTPLDVQRAQQQQ